jgi:hypothetical protein
LAGLYAALGGLNVVFIVSGVPGFCFWTVSVVLSRFNFPLMAGVSLSNWYRDWYSPQIPLLKSTALQPVSFSDGLHGMQGVSGSNPLGSTIQNHSTARGFRVF